MINAAQFKCLSVFSIFAIIGFGPISPGCLIGLYIVAMRPQWFRRLVNAMYDYPDLSDFITARQTRNARSKSLLCLLALLTIDIVPVPVTPVVAFAIILSRPMWFYRVVRHVYGDAA